MNNENAGPIEILCDEINVDFTEDMESVSMVVNFTKVLVDEIDNMIGLDKHLAKLTEKDVPEETINALDCVKNLLTIDSREQLIEAAAKAHNVTYVPDEGPCDHYIDMLSSCVSAIRFGLAVPCMSRHAASAANHVWKRKYGVRLFDKHSNDWGKQWAKMKFNEALESPELLND